MAAAAPAPASFATRITRLFGIRHPILAGGLMWLADDDYVSAVVNAGAMGFMTPRSFPDLEAFKAALVRCGEKTEGKPFGVNLYVSARDEENEKLRRFLDAALAAGVRHFETAGRSPEPFLPALREAGSVVMHKVTTIRHALSAHRAGVDAIALIGTECGGHPGMNEVPAFVLAARAAELIECPLVIGGGIGTGRQLAAALALGADAVLLGTRLLVAEEVWADRAYKEHLLGLDETCSMTVLKSVKNTYRCLINDTAREVARLEADGVRDYETLGPLVRGALQREAYETGDWNRGILSVGPSAVFCDRIEPAAAIIDRLVTEAAAQTRRLGALGGSLADAAE